MPAKPILFLSSETYEQWIERVCIYEQDRARRAIANGKPIDAVLENMSNRIMQKMLHPLLMAIKDTPNNYDAVEARKQYEELCLIQNRKPPADHVTD